MKKTTTSTIPEYNNLQKTDIQEICDFLALTINTVLKKSDSKIWHGSPVWFIDGNPIVSYSVQKGDKITLMFFSGQSFDEKELQPQGKFKAAQIVYTNKTQIKITHLKRWLKKAKQIQWDYKNIIKRKGVLLQVIKK